MLEMHHSGREPLKYCLIQVKGRKVPDMSDIQLNCKDICSLANAAAQIRFSRSGYILSPSVHS